MNTPTTEVDSRDDPTSTRLSAVPRVLFVSASPREEDSFSIPLAMEFLDRLLELRPETTVDRLDTFTDLEPFGAAHATAKMAVIGGEEVPSDVRSDWDQALAIGDRLKAADLLLIAAPMWNGGLPWSLKLFIDIVTQPGVAFRFDPEAGYSGLLAGRTAVTALTSRVFAPGKPPAFGADHHSSYLRWWLAYCGIDPVHELRLQPTFPDDGLPDRQAKVSAEARALAERLATPVPVAVS